MNFSRRSSTGSSIPSWLTEPGPVYVKRHVRPSKFVPLVEKADVLQANAHYAHIRYPDGRETTVSTKHLAPYGQVEDPESSQPQEPSTSTLPRLGLDVPGEHLQDTGHHADELPEPNTEPEPVVLRRSQRERRPIDRLNL